MLRLCEARKPVTACTMPGLSGHDRVRMKSSASTILGGLVVNPLLVIEVEVDLEVELRPRERENFVAVDAGGDGIFGGVIERQWRGIGQI